MPKLTIDNLSIEEIFFIGTISIGVLLISVPLVSWLRVSKNLRVGYTRKIFHLFIFNSAFFIQIYFGIIGVIIFGTLVFMWVLRAVIQSDGNPFYEALARSSDAPNRSLYIILPLLGTAFGGMINALLFGPYALVGYLVVGWGDAVGEPIGTAFGRHPYRVKVGWGTSSTRTLEGSLAVLIASYFASLLALSLAFPFLPAFWIIALGIAGVSTLIEAISSHGLDNLTVQVGSAATAYFLCNGLI